MNTVWVLILAISYYSNPTRQYVAQTLVMPAQYSSKESCDQAGDAMKAQKLPEGMVWDWRNTTVGCVPLLVEAIAW